MHNEHVFSLKIELYIQIQYYMKKNQENTEKTYEANSGRDLNRFSDLFSRSDSKS